VDSGQGQWTGGHWTGAVDWGALDRGSGLGGTGEGALDRGQWTGAVGSGCYKSSGRRRRAVLADCSGDGRELPPFDDKRPGGCVCDKIYRDEYFKPERGFGRFLRNRRDLRRKIRSRFRVARGIVVCANAATATDDLTDEEAPERIGEQRPCRFDASHAVLKRTSSEIVVRHAAQSSNARSSGSTTEIVRESDQARQIMAFLANATL
jgi:hypothetical protein